MRADQIVTIITIAALLGAGLIAGVFFAFSTFVMKALAKLPPRDGIAAMQSINVVVINPAFLGVFLGTTMLSAVAMIVSLVSWESPRSMCVIPAAICYVVGTFGVTIWCNVPLNNILAQIQPDDVTAPDAWNDYVRRWTRWNHVRTGCALAAAGLFTLAIAVGH